MDTSNTNPLANGESPEATSTLASDCSAINPHESGEESGAITNTSESTDSQSAGAMTDNAIGFVIRAVQGFEQYAEMAPQQLSRGQFKQRITTIIAEMDKCAKELGYNGVLAVEVFAPHAKRDYRQFPRDELTKVARAILGEMGEIIVQLTAEQAPDESQDSAPVVAEPDTAAPEAQDSAPVDAAPAEPEAQVAEPQPVSQTGSVEPEPKAVKPEPKAVKPEPKAVEPARSSRRRRRHRKPQSAPQFIRIKGVGQPVADEQMDIANKRMRGENASRLENRGVNGLTAPMGQAQVFTGDDLVGGVLGQLHGQFDQFDDSEPTRLLVYQRNGRVGKYESIGAERELMWISVREGAEPQMQPSEIRNRHGESFVACHRIAGFVPKWARSAAQRGEYREPWDEERDAQWHEIHLVWVPATPPEPVESGADGDGREPAASGKPTQSGPRRRRRRRRNRSGGSAEPVESGADAEPSQPIDHNGRHRNPRGKSRERQDGNRRPPRHGDARNGTASQSGSQPEDGAQLSGRDSRRNPANVSGSETFRVVAPDSTPRNAIQEAMLRALEDAGTVEVVDADQA